MRGRLARRMSGLRLTAVVLFLAALFACVSQWSPPEPAGRHRTQAVVGAGGEIGASQCYDCHDAFDDHVRASAQRLTVNSTLGSNDSEEAISIRSESGP